MLDPEKVSQHIERGVIEIAPLAFMRGRTLNDSFVILDEGSPSKVTDIFTGASISIERGRIVLSEAFAQMPVAMLHS